MRCPSESGGEHASLLSGAVAHGVDLGVTHEVVADLLPMSRETLTALTQEMLMVNCAAGVIKNLRCAIGASDFPSP